jgi:hypothetical protein
MRSNFGLMIADVFVDDHDDHHDVRYQQRCKVNQLVGSAPDESVMAERVVVEKLLDQQFELVS